MIREKAEYFAMDLCFVVYSDIRISNGLHPQHDLDANGAYWMTTFWHILVSCKMEAINPLKS